MAGAQADAIGLVGAVDQVAGPAERELVLAQRIVRARRHHRRHRIAVLLVLLAHRGRRPPDRVLLRDDDLGDAFRRLPADLADADRVRVDHLRLALLVLREVVDAHRREVDDDAFARRIGQHELRGHHDLAARARQPRIDARIGAHDLFVADVEAPRDVRQRVFLAGDGDLHLADHVVVSGIELEAMRGHRHRQYRRRRRRRHDHRRRRRLRLRPGRAEQRTAGQQQAPMPAAPRRQATSLPGDSCSAILEQYGLIRQLVAPRRLRRGNAAPDCAATPRTAGSAPASSRRLRNCALDLVAQRLPFRLGHHARQCRGRRRSRRCGRQAARRSARRCCAAVSQTPQRREHLQGALARRQRRATAAPGRSAVSTAKRISPCVPALGRDDLALDLGAARPAGTRSRSAAAGRPRSAGCSAAHASPAPRGAAATEAAATAAEPTATTETAAAEAAATAAAAQPPPPMPRAATSRAAPAPVTSASTKASSAGAERERPAAG